MAIFPLAPDQYHSSDVASYNTDCIRISDNIVPINNTSNAAFSEFHDISRQCPSFVRKYISDLQDKVPQNYVN